jgi:hypothetical protein
MPTSTQAAQLIAESLWSNPKFYIGVPLWITVAYIFWRVWRWSEGLDDK